MDRGSTDDGERVMCLRETVEAFPSQTNDIIFPKISDVRSLSNSLSNKTLHANRSLNSTNVRNADGISSGDESLSSRKFAVSFKSICMKKQALRSNLSLIFICPHVIKKSVSKCSKCSGNVNYAVARLLRKARCFSKLKMHKNFTCANKRRYVCSKYVGSNHRNVRSSDLQKMPVTSSPLLSSLLQERRRIMLEHDYAVNVERDHSYSKVSGDLCRHVDGSTGFLNDCSEANYTPDIDDVVRKCRQSSVVDFCNANSMTPTNIESDLSKPYVSAECLEECNFQNILGNVTTTGKTNLIEGEEEIVSDYSDKAVETLGDQSVFHNITNEGSLPNYQDDAHCKISNKTNVKMTDSGPRFISKNSTQGNVIKRIDECLIYNREAEDCRVTSCEGEVCSEVSKSDDEDFFKERGQLKCLRSGRLVVIPLRPTVKSRIDVSTVSLVTKSKETTYRFTNDCDMIKKAALKMCSVVITPLQPEKIASFENRASNVRALLNSESTKVSQRQIPYVLLNRSDVELHFAQCSELGLQSRNSVEFLSDQEDAEHISDYSIQEQPVAPGTLFTLSEKSVQQLLEEEEAQLQNVKKFGKLKTSNYERYDKGTDETSTTNTEFATLHRSKDSTIVKTEDILDNSCARRRKDHIVSNNSLKQKLSRCSYEKSYLPDNCNSFLTDVSENKDKSIELLLKEQEQTLARIRSMTVVSCTSLDS